VQGHAIEVDRIKMYPSHAFSGLHEIVRTYLQSAAPRIQIS